MRSASTAARPATTPRLSSTASAWSSIPRAPRISRAPRSISSSRCKSRASRSRTRTPPARAAAATASRWPRATKRPPPAAAATSSPISVSDWPLRVAVVGSGPAGFYAADCLLSADARVDLLERLPTPWGLVRLGVAPDHPELKSAARAFEKTAAKEGFRFFGNVEVGRDVTHHELTRIYDALVYTVGAQTDRRLGIPGEDLPGSWAATEFVAWYNGHPDYQHLEFDLTNERAVVIGNG